MTAEARPAPSGSPLLQIDNLVKHYGARGGARKPAIRAVNDISLTLRAGETLGLVGESGCGKSTTGRCIIGLEQPTGGRIVFDGKPVEHGKRAALTAMWRDMQYVFQDPFASLNPRLRVEDIVGEAPKVHGLVPDGDVSGYVAQTLKRVGLDPSYARRYPHQFSGGQRARIGIARALAVQPEFLICDEAVAALDVSIQAQVLNLFMDLRESLGLTYLFISHDLGVVHHLADRVVVMYLGRVVEIAPTPELFARPNHPYTQALLAEVPRIDRKKRTYVPIKGEIPSPLAPPSGCHFHPRCPHAMPRCASEAPALREIAAGRLSACHLNDGA